MDENLSGAADLLLVEDNGDLREALVQLLILKGYTVEGVKDGIEALSKMKHGTSLPKLVITDLQMPGDGNGWLLRQNMLDDVELASIPVVVMSAVLPVESKETLQAAAYIEKPASLASLLKVIEKHVH